jgi:hypothetical protein
MSEFNNINQQLNIVANTAGLIRALNLKNIHVPDARDNKYNPSVLSGDPTKSGADIALNTPQNQYNENLLGTPIFADLTLNGGVYYDNLLKKDVTFPTIRFATVIMTVDFVARIIKTEIQGRDGSVKEYIGQDDAKIAIQGVITGYNGHYPQNEVNLLNLWRKAPVAKAVTSTFLNQTLGINSLVVEDCSLPQVAGGYSYQTFTMNCISDLPVELKIANNV